MTRATPKKKKFARKLRKEPTKAELHLWKAVGQKGLGMFMMRQAVISGFIVDFFVPSILLIIEVDGGYHTEEKAQAYDRKREKILKMRGNWFIRFTNEEVLAMSASDIKTAVYKAWRERLTRNVPVV